MSLYIAAKRSRGIEHMCSHAPGCRLPIAFRYRLHDRIVLVPRPAETFTLSKLRAPEGNEPGAHRYRMFGEECVMRGAIDSFVELAIERIIGVEITFLDHRQREIVQFDQMASLKRRHTISRQPYAHRLDFGRCFEHVHDALGRHARDDNSAPRTHLDETADRQLT